MFTALPHEDPVYEQGNVTALKCPSRHKKQDFKSHVAEAKAISPLC